MTIPGQFVATFNTLVLRNDLVDRSEREGFCGRERLAFKNGG